MRVALDTNVLVYAEGLNDSARRDRALDVLAELPANGIVAPVQALGELHRILVRKGGLTAAAASVAALRWADAFETLPSTTSAMRDALGLAEVHALQIWDALVLAVAQANGCTVLLSEDLQDGFVWRGLEVLNPFEDKRWHALKKRVASA